MRKAGKSTLTGLEDALAFAQSKATMATRIVNEYAEQSISRPSAMGSGAAGCSNTSQR